MRTSSIVLAVAAVVAVLSEMAFAQSFGGSGAGSTVKPVVVPEIDALAGVAAIAAVAGVFALVRDRAQR